MFSHFIPVALVLVGFAVVLIRLKLW